MDRALQDRRAPLNEAEVRRALCSPQGPFRAVFDAIRVVDRTGSTNADLVAAAAVGAADRTALVAEQQDAGRGRLSRDWVSPRLAGLTVSVLFRPVGVPASRLGWVPLLAGLALYRAVTEHAAVPAALKWPNDLLVGQAGQPGTAAAIGPAAMSRAAMSRAAMSRAVMRKAAMRKAGGILVESTAAPAVVIGIGLNVSSTADELPPGATSLRLAGAADATLDRTGLLVALLRRLSGDEALWRAAHGDPVASGLRAGYRDACATIGLPVRAELPGGRRLTGTAVDVDDHGRLLIRPETGELRTVAAGDVVHLRTLR